MTFLDAPWKHLAGVAVLALSALAGAAAAFQEGDPDENRRENDRKSIEISKPTAVDRNSRKSDPVDYASLYSDDNEQSVVWNNGVGTPATTTSSSSSRRPPVEAGSETPLSEERDTTGDDRMDVFDPSLDPDPRTDSDEPRYGSIAEFLIDWPLPELTQLPDIPDGPIESPLPMPPLSDSDIRRLNFSRVKADRNLADTMTRVRQNPGLKTLGDGDSNDGNPVVTSNSSSNASPPHVIDPNYGGIPPGVSNDYGVIPPPARIYDPAPFFPPLPPTPE
jgi:hypothetical protein